MSWLRFVHVVNTVIFWLVRGLVILFVVLGTVLVLGLTSGCGKRDTYSTNHVLPQHIEYATEKCEGNGGVHSIRLTGATVHPDGRVAITRIAFSCNNGADFNEWRKP